MVQTNGRQSHWFRGVQAQSRRDGFRQWVDIEQEAASWDVGRANNYTSTRGLYKSAPGWRTLCFAVTSQFGQGEHKLGRQILSGYIGLSLQWDRRQVAASYARITEVQRTQLRPSVNGWWNERWPDTGYVTLSRTDIARAHGTPCVTNERSGRICAKRDTEEVRQREQEMECAAVWPKQTEFYR